MKIFVNGYVNIYKCNSIINFHKEKDLTQILYGVLLTVNQLKKDI
uniref:Uncharacterized protein n=1 Tax=Lepeophtheirus salmonis TaxID=72036 RepID=A0A0K2UBN7_LEPSM